MSGNAKNTALWANADVYLADVDTEGPADLAAGWGSDWELVGLLDGSEGFTESREEETGEKYAWGGRLYRRTKSQHKRSIKFVALEDNRATFRLVNPGSVRSTVGGVRTSKIVVPKIDAFAIGFELRDGERVKRRFVKHAEVSEIGDVKDSEEDSTVYEITVLIFPEDDGTLYTTVETDPDAVPAAS
jgi:hypothetical protein